MKVLLDAHVFLWYVSDDPKLPGTILLAHCVQMHTIFGSSSNSLTSLLSRVPIPDKVVFPGR